MLRGLMIAAAVAAVPGAALAQYGAYKPYQPYTGYTAPAPPPTPSTTYDWQSGNSYRTTPQQDGSTTVQGNNYQNGSAWRTTIKPNGDQTGTDANGNMWRYNQSSGSYMNSDGTTCYGKGAFRTCN